MTAMSAAGREKLDRLRVKDPQLELPWNGRSPRALTRMAMKIRLDRETTTVDESFNELSAEEVNELYRR